MSDLYQYDAGNQALVFGIPGPGGKLAIIGIHIEALRMVGHWDPKTCKAEAFQKALPRFNQEPSVQLAPAQALRGLPPLARGRR
jgi:hypothetical protein